MDKKLADQKAALLKKTELYKTAISEQLDANFGKTKKQIRKAVIAGGVIIVFYSVSRLVGGSRTRKKIIKIDELQVPKESAPPLVIEKNIPAKKADSLSTMIKQGITTVAIALAREAGTELLTSFKDSFFENLQKNKH